MIFASERDLTVSLFLKDSLNAHISKSVEFNNSWMKTPGGKRVKDFFTFDFNEVDKLSIQQLFLHLIFERNKKRKLLFLLFLKLLDIILDRIGLINNPKPPKNLHKLTL